MFYRIMERRINEESKLQWHMLIIAMGPIKPRISTVGSHVEPLATKEL